MGGGEHLKWRKDSASSVSIITAQPTVAVPEEVPVTNNRKRGWVGYSSGVYICNSIVNYLRHGNFICESEVIYLTYEHRIAIPVEFTYVNQKKMI